jgi:tRNA1(Val) A37 N6-methylase TrmN6
VKICIFELSKKGGSKLMLQPNIFIKKKAIKYEDNFLAKTPLMDI